MLTIQFPGMFGIQMVSQGVKLDHFIENLFFYNEDPNTVRTKSGLIWNPEAKGIWFSNGLCEVF